MREYRVSRNEGDAEIKLPEDHRADPEAIKQTVKTRGSNALEWSRYDEDSLWKSWSDELSEQDENREQESQITREDGQKLQWAQKDSSLSVSETSQKEIVLPQKSIDPSRPFGAYLPWAATLAHEEIKMAREGTIDFHNSFKRQEQLRRQTTEFCRGLYQRFREEVEVFNDARREAQQFVHIYRVSKTESDFMLYRNSVKLVVSASKAGRILFIFNQFLGEAFSPTIQPKSEIEGSWNPFGQLVWQFKGERIQAADIVKFFLTEFVYQSYK